MNKLNAFMREFVAIVKGDDTEALAAKVWRQGEAALKVAIAGAEGDLISKEEDVESFVFDFEKPKPIYTKEQYETLKKKKQIKKRNREKKKKLEILRKKYPNS